MKNTTKLNFLFLVLGVLLFSFFVYKLGIEAVELIKSQINFYYFILFIIIIFLSFIPYTYRLKVILKAYGYTIPIFKLVKQTIAGFAVSYITPVSRLGGEPLRIYLLKKECGVDYKVGTTGVILDKFIEILGSASYGIIGLVLLIYTIPTPLIFKIIFGSCVVLSLIVLGAFYYCSVHQYKSLSALLRLIKLDKKYKKFNKALIDIESHLSDFFINHKKSFCLSFMFYIISGMMFILEFKFLLLSIGINVSILSLILIINIWGLINFIPVPGGLGFLEASQSGIFYLLVGDGTVGLSMSLLLRVGYLMVVCLGFIFIFYFGSKKIMRQDNILSKSLKV